VSCDSPAAVALFHETERNRAIIVVKCVTKMYHICGNAHGYCRKRLEPVKVKFSHTRYRALGPELIPVYRQSARR